MGDQNRSQESLQEQTVHPTSGYPHQTTPQYPSQGPTAQETNIMQFQDSFFLQIEICNTLLEWVLHLAQASIRGEHHLKHREAKVLLQEKKMQDLLTHKDRIF